MCSTSRCLASDDVLELYFPGIRQDFESFELRIWDTMMVDVDAGAVGVVRNYDQTTMIVAPAVLKNTNNFERIKSLADH